MCVIGVREWERRTPQRIEIDFAIDLPIDRPAKSGRVEDSVDYSDACTVLSDFIEREEFGLLEALVHDCILLLKDRYPSAQRIALAVRKPGAVSDARHAGVRAEVRYDTSPTEAPLHGERP